VGVEKMKMIAVIRSRTRVQEEKSQLAARSFPSDKRARVEQEEEREGQTADEVEIIEVVSEPGPIRVESGNSLDEEGGSAGEDGCFLSY
jgi:hypothetical protein